MANIEPGEQVAISDSQAMTLEDGRFEFNFPAVVGPRQISGETPGDDQPVSVEPPMPPMFRKQDPQRSPEGEAPVVNPDPGTP